MQTVSKRSSTGPVRTSSTPCGTGERSSFSFGVLERPRYYPRQLMTPNELQLEADYFRDRLRRHNIYLHGWGVVCGALVCVVPSGRQTANRSDYQRAQVNGPTNGNGNGNGNEAWLVRVHTGYVLGPYGDEIIIDRPLDVDLRGTGISGCGADSSDDLAEPWCSEVFVDRPVGTVYVAVRYKECPVRPVRSQPTGCGCDDAPCEYSRFRDGFEIGLLDCCPASHHPDDLGGGEGRNFGNPDCPACPDSPWVVLAEVAVSADGTVTKIDNCSCRRIAFSARERWAQCSATDCDQPRENVKLTPAVAPAADGTVTDEPKPAVAPDTTPAAGEGDQPVKRRRARGRST